MTKAQGRLSSFSDTDTPQDGGEFAFGKRTSQQRATVAVAWFALSLMAVFVLWQAATSPSAMANPWTDLAYAGLLGLFCLAAYGATRLKPFGIRDGLMTLPWPIRDASGRKRRNLSLAEIRSVTPALSERQESGMLVTLRDGTDFYLWDPDLPPGASSYLLDMRHRAPQSPSPAEKL